MKRFCCALIILSITITSAAMLNKKMINAADEMLYIIEYDFRKDEIIKEWDSNRLLFSLLLTQSQIEKIQTSVENIKNNSETDNSIMNLKDELNGIRGSVQLSIENIL